ncbi:MAG: hypothetical protein U9O89_06430 [Thermoproteota archaeon]|nr:hypothetical protein [Thermoproteota archaeon]
MNQETSSSTKISTFILTVIILILVLSLTSIYLAVMASPGLESGDFSAGYFLIIGFIGLALSIYMLYQTKRSVLRLSIKTPPVLTTIVCQKCGFKNIRDFREGDYIFKGMEPCPKCNEKMVITSIYREAEEKKRRF